MQTENVLNDSRLRALENHTRVNLLRPTLGTTTINGVTCTNNGDGTYTLNGTASGGNCNFYIGKKKPDGKTYRLVGCPSVGSTQTYFFALTDDVVNSSIDTGNGNIITLIDNGCDYSFLIAVIAGTTVNNLVFKPMLTTDLTATYDDFVSYEDSLAINRNAAQKQDVLTLEEIQASTDLTGKIASASALKDFVKRKTVSVTTNNNGSAIINLSTDYVVVSIFSLSTGYKLVPVVANNTWYVNAYDTTGTTMSAQTNKTITVEVYYI